MKAMMLDLETLGLGPKALFWQVGCCIFNPYDATYPPIAYKSKEVDIIDALQNGRVIDSETVNFWMSQISDRQSSMYEPRRTMRLVLEEVFGTYRDEKCEQIWANSPAFDCVIVEDAAKDLGMQVPWSYRDHRDVRTLRKIASHLNVREVRSEITHDASKDAEDQALLVQNLFESMLAISNR